MKGWLILICIAGILVVFRDFGPFMFILKAIQGIIAFSVIAALAWLFIDRAMCLFRGSCNNNV